MDQTETLCYKKIEKQIKEHKFQPLIKTEKVNPDYKKVILTVARPIIRLHYGPCKCNHILKYRIQRLYGLIGTVNMRIKLEELRVSNVLIILEKLIQMNYEIELLQSSHVDRLIVKMVGYEIDRINIKHLKFNYHKEDDPACTAIIDNIIEATQRLMSRRNITQDLNYIYTDSYLEFDCGTSLLDTFH